MAGKPVPVRQQNRFLLVERCGLNTGAGCDDVRAGRQRFGEQQRDRLPHGGGKRPAAGHLGIATGAVNHIGDGNLHFAVSVGGEEGEHLEGVQRCVYEPLASEGGSISAEHGIGLEKKRWLPLCRTDQEIELMRKIKRALDPNGILNPGKIFDQEVA